MLKIRTIQNFFAPKMKFATEKAMNTTKKVITISEEPQCSGADAIARQNQAMVELTKKPYKKPDIKVYDYEAEDILSESNPGTATDKLPDSSDSYVKQLKIVDFDDDI